MMNKSNNKKKQKKERKKKKGKSNDKKKKLETFSNAQLQQIGFFPVLFEPET